MHARVVPHTVSATAVYPDVQIVVWVLHARRPRRASRRCRMTHSGCSPSGSLAETSRACSRSCSLLPSPMGLGWRTVRAEVTSTLLLPSFARLSLLIRAVYSPKSVNIHNHIAKTPTPNPMNSPATITRPYPRDLRGALVPCRHTRHTRGTRTGLPRAPIRVGSHGSGSATASCPRLCCMPS
jgi:hypothetical protein